MMMTYRNRHSGFGLIEVLVALVITLVAVLGAVGLSVKTTQQEVESYQRVQALALLQEMVERMNTNRQAALCYSSGTVGLTVGAGTTHVFACSIATAPLSTTAQQARMVADLAEWDSHLKGALEQTGTTQVNVGAVIGALGCIVLIDATNHVYRLTVAWQGLGPTTSVPQNLCGKGQYGADDKLRRTVNAVIHL